MTLHSDMIHILQWIYDHQTLTLNQLNFLLNQEQTNPKAVVQQLNQLKLQGYLETAVSSPNNPNYFLTDQGVKAVREALNLPKNILSPTKQILYQGYYQASKLKPTPKQIDRQNRLNDLEILIQQNIERRGLSAYRYFDRKFFPAELQFTKAQGAFQLCGHWFLLHLEGRDYTEKGLTRLFKQYLNEPIGSEEDPFSQTVTQKLQGEATLLVVAQTKASVLAWKKALYPILPQLTSSQLNVVIGTKEDILTYLFLEYLPKTKGACSLIQQSEQALKKIGCQVDYHDFSQVALIGAYQGVIHSPQTHRSILFSYYDTKSQASLQAYLNHILNYEALTTKGYPATFLLIVPNISQLHEELRTLSDIEDVFNTPLSYVTTPEHLKQANTLEESLLQLTQSGWEKGVLPPHLI